MAGFSWLGERGAVSREVFVFDFCRFRTQVEEHGHQGREGGGDFFGVVFEFFRAQVVLQAVCSCAVNHPLDAFLDAPGANFHHTHFQSDVLVEQENKYFDVPDGIPGQMRPKPVQVISEPIHVGRIDVDAPLRQVTEPLCGHGSGKGRIDDFRENERVEQVDALAIAPGGKGCQFDHVVVEVVQALFQFIGDDVPKAGGGQQTPLGPGFALPAGAGTFLQVLVDSLPGLREPLQGALKDSHGAQGVDFDGDS